MGRALGGYHSQAGRKLKTESMPPIFPQMVPWILSLHRTNPSAIQNLSAGNGQLMSLLQRYPEFPLALDALASQWRKDTLIHGDMKLENCVQYRNVGDACWDVGAILQAYLNLWIFSMPMSDLMSPDQMVEKATTPLEKLWPAIRAFWNSYAETMGVKGSDAEELLERCARHSAARMLQTVFESLTYQQQLNAQSIVLLQTSLNMLQNPREAARVLLGLGKEIHAGRVSA
jgi:hypothetical protein